MAYVRLFLRADKSLAWTAATAGCANCNQSATEKGKVTPLPEDVRELAHTVRARGSRAETHLAYRLQDDCPQDQTGHSGDLWLQTVVEAVYAAFSIGASISSVGLQYQS